MNSSDYPILSFQTPNEWREWLEQNHDTVSGVWLRFFKKNSNVATIVYAQALDEALCYGWIDSQAKKYDEQSYLQKFTPRRSKSMWSVINKANIERLIKEKKMKPAGMVQVEQAKKDGRWDAAYSSSGTMEIPQDFMKELHKNKKATEFFQTLSKANTYAIAWRLQTAKKPETRERRMKAIFAMLAKKEKFY